MATDDMIYTKLADIGSCRQKCNVFGVVISTSNDFDSSGKFRLRIQICDESLSVGETIQCTFVGQTARDLPVVKKRSEIIRIHRCIVVMDKRMLYGQISVGGCHCVVWDGSIDSDMSSRSTSRNFSGFETAKHRVKELREWFLKNDKFYFDGNKSLSNVIHRKKTETEFDFLPFSTIDQGNYCNLLCQLIGIFYTKRNATVIRVWDGTTINNFNHFHADLESDVTKIYMYSKELDQKVGDKSVDIFVYDDFVEEVIKFKIGDYLKIYNLHAFYKFCDLQVAMSLHGLNSTINNSLALSRKIVKLHETDPLYDQFVKRLKLVEQNLEFQQKSASNNKSNDQNMSSTLANSMDNDDNESDVEILESIISVPPPSRKQVQSIRTNLIDNKAQYVVPNKQNEPKTGRKSIYAQYVSKKLSDSQEKVLPQLLSSQLVPIVEDLFLKHLKEFEQSKLKVNSPRNYLKLSIKLIELGLVVDKISVGQFEYGCEDLIRLNADNFNWTPKSGLKYDTLQNLAKKFKCRLSSPRVVTPEPLLSPVVEPESLKRCKPTLVVKPKLSSPNSTCSVVAVKNPKSITLISSVVEPKTSNAVSTAVEPKSTITAPITTSSIVEPKSTITATISTSSVVESKPIAVESLPEPVAASNDSDSDTAPFILGYDQYGLQISMGRFLMHGVEPVYKTFRDVPRELFEQLEQRSEDYSDGDDDEDEEASDNDDDDDDDDGDDEEEEASDDDDNDDEDDEVADDDDDDDADDGVCDDSKIQIEPLMTKNLASKNLRLNRDEPINDFDAPSCKRFKSINDEETQTSQPLSSLGDNDFATCDDNQKRSKSFSKNYLDIESCNDNDDYQKPFSFGLTSVKNICNKARLVVFGK